MSYHSAGWLTAPACNTVLFSGFSHGTSLDAMKLNRILYVLSCEYHHEKNGVLLSEPFSVSKYGPVLASTYAQFDMYRGQPIASYAKDARGRSIRYSLGGSMSVELFGRVWRACTSLSSVALARVVRGDESGWMAAWRDGRRFLCDDDIARDYGYRESLFATVDEAAIIG